MLDSWSHWLTLARESRHKCPCVCFGASEVDWGASDKTPALLPSCWWNQSASERTTERISQLTRFFSASSTSWAPGLVWEGVGRTSCLWPRSQREFQASVCEQKHPWSQALCSWCWTHSNDRRLQWSGAIRNRFAEPTGLGQWMGRNRLCEYCVDIGESMACLSEHSACIV